MVSGLLENSIEHGGAEPPIQVDVETGEQTVAVTVADDGPGIPAHEIQAVTGNEPITQLSRGSGLGLWFVTWMIETYGDTVDFTELAGSGTVVEVRLPRTGR